jgi:hypothetical protein
VLRGAGSGKCPRARLLKNKERDTTDTAARRLRNK